MSDFGIILFVKKRNRKPIQERIHFPPSAHWFFARFLTCYKEQTLMLKLWRQAQTTFLQCSFCLFCLPFFGNNILWRFEESQTLSWFMHVNITANTCHIASTGVNEIRIFLRLKHIFTQPSCFLQIVSFRVIGTQLEVCWVFVSGRWYLLATHFKTRHVKSLY